MWIKDILGAQKFVSATGAETVALETLGRALIVKVRQPQPDGVLLVLDTVTARRERREQK